MSARWKPTYQLFICRCMLCMPVSRPQRRTFGVRKLRTTGTVSGRWTLYVAVFRRRGGSRGRVQLHGQLERSRATGKRRLVGFLSNFFHLCAGLRPNPVRRAFAGGGCPAVCGALACFRGRGRCTRGAGAVHSHPSSKHTHLPLCI